MVELNKNIITCKNPTKEMKKLCKLLRKVFEPKSVPNSRYKSTSQKLISDDIQILKISHIITLEKNRIKILYIETGEIYIFDIVTQNLKFKNMDNTFYNMDPNMTFSGKSEYSGIFKSLSTEPEDFKRNIHIQFDGDNIIFRHYAVITKESEDIKVGFEEIGPRLTLKFKAIANSKKK